MCSDKICFDNWLLINTRKWDNEQKNWTNRGIGRNILNENDLIEIEIEMMTIEKYEIIERPH
jgi:hypothetical protein